MRRAPGSVDTNQTMLRAFRDLTDARADGAATRARVLVVAGRAAARRALLRRIGLPIVTTLVLASSVSAALSGVYPIWRRPVGARIETPDSDRLAGTTDYRAVRVIPPAEPAIIGAPTTALSPRRSLADDREARAYGRAHLAHFVEGEPARALAAWDAYLAAFPRGTFAPEATYNRTICLVRLGRHGEATQALRVLADAPGGGYRRDEARRLLDWLADAPVKQISARRRQSPSPGSAGVRSF